MYGITVSDSDRGNGVAFLLAQLGHHASDLFAERIASIGLTPPQAGIVRAIASEPGRSQQSLSTKLGLLPSRMVAFVDELENRGYVERRRNPDDRRLHALHLTASGKRMMQKLSVLARQHEDQMTAGLSDKQRDTLRELLAAVAREQRLAPRVHPGYRKLGPPVGIRR